MARKKVVPKIKYVQVENPDQYAVDEVFKYLLDKFFEQEKLKKTNSPSRK